MYKHIPTITQTLDQLDADFDQSFVLLLCARVAAISLSAENLSALQLVGLEHTRSIGANLNSETADGLQ